MRSIPASQLAQVNPGVLAPAGTLDDLNGLILTNSLYPPIGGTIEFADADDVGLYFGYDSDEYQSAQIYFQAPDNATKTPSKLLFAQYPSEAVSAFLRGGKLGLTLAQLQALAGSLVVTIDGVANSSAAIDLSAVTSFSEAATVILAGFTAPNFTVAYDTQHDAFQFTSSSTGATSTAAFATGTLAAGLNLLVTSAGAVVSQGAIAATPATEMATLASADQTWSVFMTIFEPVTADKVAFSAWASAQDNRYCYVGYDSDPNAAVANSTTTWAYQIIQAKYSGTVPIYGNVTHAAFVLSYAASLDFTRLNGRWTIAFKSQSGLVPFVTDGTAALALLGNGYNFYGAYATSTQQFNMLQNGSVTGEYLWLDSFLNQIWMRANLQLALINLLVSTGSIPYNNDGYAMIDAAIADPVAAAINFGAIRAGVTLSASQAQAVNQAVGLTVAPSIQALGYYVQVAAADPATRIARQSPPITLFYTDGQSVQQLVLASIEVQ